MGQQGLMIEKKDQLSWSGFMLLQPVLLIYSYLVGCLLDSVFQIFGPEPSAFPINQVMLVFICPATLVIGVVLYLITKTSMSFGRVILCLFLIVPILAGLSVEFVLFLISSQLSPFAPG